MNPARIYPLAAADKLVAGKASGRDLVIYLDITFIDIFRRARLVEQGHRGGVCGRQLPKCEGRGRRARPVIGREEVVHQAASVVGYNHPDRPTGCCRSSLDEQISRPGAAPARRPTWSV